MLITCEVNLYHVNSVFDNKLVKCAVSLHFDFQRPLISSFFFVKLFCFCKQSSYKATFCPQNHGRFLSITIQRTSESPIHPQSEYPIHLVSECPIHSMSECPIHSMSESPIHLVSEWLMWHQVQSFRLFFTFWGMKYLNPQFYFIVFPHIFQKSYCQQNDLFSFDVIF